MSQPLGCDVPKPGPSLRTSKGFLEGPERLLLSWVRPWKKVGTWAAGVQRDQSPVYTGAEGEVVKGLGGILSRDGELLTSGVTPSDLPSGGWSPGGSAAHEDSFLGNTVNLETGPRGMPAAILRTSICVPAPRPRVPPFSLTGSCSVLFVLVMRSAGVRCLSQSGIRPPPTSPSAVKGPCSTRLLTRKRKDGSAQ